MKVLALVMWILVCLAVPLAALILFGGMASATGAPQEAVVVCLAIAVAVIPYVFARAVTEIATLTNDNPSKPTNPQPPPRQPTEPEFNYKKKESTAFLDLGR